MKEIPGYEGYYARKDGMLFSTAKGTSNPRGKFLSQTLHHSGYLVVSAIKDGQKKSVPVHRMIALALCDNTNGLPQVNHKNGIKTDNRAENLGWCTVGDNVRHAERTGLRKHEDWGHDNTRAKLTNAQARVIKKCAELGINQDRLASIFGISQGLVSSIKRGINYGRI